MIAVEFIALGGRSVTADDFNTAIAMLREAAPTIRDAEELHDALMSLYLLRCEDEYLGYATELIATHRATRLVLDTQHYWVAAERLPMVRAAINGACVPPMPALPYPIDVPDPELAAVQIVRGHMEQLGPRSAEGLREPTGLSLAQIQSALGTLEGQGVVLRGSYTATARQQGISEWCDKRMLARIQRLTVARLRKEIEPVNAALLNRFLFHWQRVGQDTKLIGADGLLQVVAQLQGFESAAGAWEKEILTARLHGYNTEWLDALCLSGQVAWARLSPKQPGPARSPSSTPTRAAPLTLMLRDDMSWLRAAAASTETELLSETAQQVREVLSRRGASFLRDLVASTALKAPVAEDALWELVAHGHATADGFTSLRLLIERHKGETRSLFDAGSDRAKIASTRWRRTLKKSRTRDASRGAHAHLSIAAAAGRWSLLERADAGDADPMRHAKQLLQRYGVVFRDLLVRESALPPWRDILQSLRRLEARGEIRGGRFVHGFVGEQFALPEAVTTLRSLRKASRLEGPELVVVSASDPLNLVGITSPGPKVPSVVGSKILYRNGVPIAALEGGELTVLAPLEDGARVDGDLRYHVPFNGRARPKQVLLPLS